MGGVFISENKSTRLLSLQILSEMYDELVANVERGRKQMLKCYDLPKLMERNAEACRIAVLPMGKT